jgi:hypothetical protein
MKQIAAINQSTNQPTNQPTNQKYQIDNQSISQSGNQSVSQSIIDSINQTSDQENKSRRDGKWQKEATILKKKHTSAGRCEGHGQQVSHPSASCILESHL